MTKVVLKIFNENYMSYVKIPENFYHVSIQHSCCNFRRKCHDYFRIKLSLRRSVIQHKRYNSIALMLMAGLYCRTSRQLLLAKLFPSKIRTISMNILRKHHEIKLLNNWLNLSFHVEL